MPGTVARRLLAHIALRLMAATVLLGAAFVLEVRSPGSVAVDPFFTLIAVVYAVSLVFIASVRFVESFR